MYTFMLFLNQELISSVDISEGVSYTLGTNQQNSDIFIPLYDAELMIESVFSISDKMIEFSYLNCELIIPENQVILTEKSYALPQTFLIGDTEINFSINKDKDPEFNYFRLSELIEDRVPLEDLDSEYEELGVEDQEEEEPTVFSTKSFLGLLRLLRTKCKVFLVMIKPKTLVENFVYGGFLILILVSLVVGIIYLKTAKPKTVLNNPINNKSIIKSLLNKYPSVSINKASNGKYLVNGVLSNKEEINNIKQQVKNFSTTYNLITESELQQNLANLKFPQSINVQIKNNKIVVAGIATDADTISSIYEIISDTIHMDIEIDTSKVFQIGNINSDFDTLQNNPIFLGNIQVTKEHYNQTIKIYGYINESALSVLNELLIPLRQKYDGILQITNDVLNQSSIVLDIDEVYLDGNNSYIIAKQNQKIFIGGRLHEWILTEVNAKQITIKNYFNNSIVHIDLTDEVYFN